MSCLGALLYSASSARLFLHMHIVTGRAVKPYGVIAPDEIALGYEDRLAGCWAHVLQPNLLRDAGFFKRGLHLLRDALQGDDLFAVGTVEAAALPLFAHDPACSSQRN